MPVRTFVQHDFLAMRRLCLFLLVFAIAWPQAAWAAVEIHFYSKDLGASFPHAFVRLTGTVDSTGEQLDTNYGFTAVNVSPAVLMGPVAGKIQTVDPPYVARSLKHFSLPLSEEQYGKVLAVVERWRRTPQPSYRLNSRNCVFFVAEVAAALGLHAPPAPKLMKKPKSFLQKVTADNSTMISAWQGPLPAAPDAAAGTPRR